MLKGKKVLRTSLEGSIFQGMFFIKECGGQQ